MQALQVLLRHYKWEEAIDFVSCSKTSSNVALLFTVLVKALLSNRAPPPVLGEALALVPDGFSHFELLAIIRSHLPTCKEPFSRDPGQVKLGDVHAYLEEFLKPR